MEKSIFLINQFLKCTVLLLIFFGQSYAQVESTFQGGKWSDPSTWANGVVPAPGDDIIIKGPVKLILLTYAKSIQITNNTNAGLKPEFEDSNTYQLHVVGKIWNNGTIKGKRLDVYIGGQNSGAGNLPGSIYNLANGYWDTQNIFIVDTLSHPLQSEGKWFRPGNLKADSATLVTAGNVQIDSTTIHVKKIIVGQNLQNEIFTLAHHSKLYVDDFINVGGNTPSPIGGITSSSVRGITASLELYNNSRIISFISTGNYTLSRFTNIHFGGEVEISGPSTFIGDTYLDGIMMPNWSNHVPITVAGNFYNNGEIKGNLSSYFKFYISGNLTNNGPWNTYEVNFTGTGDHELSTDINYSFSSSYFNADSSTIYSKSDIKFVNTINTVLNFKKIVLQNNNSLYINNATLMIDNLVGNGNVVQFQNNSNINSFISQGNYKLSTFSNINLKGEVTMRGPSTFIGDTYLNGTMIPNWSANLPITVIGNFYNNGEIKTNSYGYNTFVFNISGNLENNGIWLTAETNLNGTSSQHIGISDTSSLGVVKIFANRVGDSFKWMLNGNQLTNGGNISGAASNILSINNFDSSFFGTIKSEIDSSGNTIYSRDIIVNDMITSVKSNSNIIPDNYSLSQNYPNPFNPSTTISYSIPAVETRHALSQRHALSVQLKVYDILGREVTTLVNKKQSAGNYKINFDASRLSSGIYFYRIIAGKFVQTKKMVLLK